MRANYSSFGNFFAEVKAARQPLCMVIFGAPGSGKGTNARKLSEALGIAHIETGAMIRAEIKAETKLGNAISGFVKGGNLVPNEVIYQLLEKRLSQPDCAKGIIFDGVPRTLEQAKKLNAILAQKGKKLNLVVNLVVSDKVVIQRMRDRAKLENRPDDLAPGVIENRIRVYHKESEPLIGYYKQRGLLVRVKGKKSPEVVYRRVRKRVRRSELTRTAKAAGIIAGRRVAGMFRARRPK